MLKNTFCHIPGIGPKIEQQLWASGILSWNQILEIGPEKFPFGERRTEKLKRSIEDSLARLQQKDTDYFSEFLPSDQHWRLFPEFRDSVAYIDIETTGMGGPTDHITTIALYDGKNIHHYVHGKNLDRFKDDISRYGLLVTYNGKCFDIPFIQNYFHVRMDQAHIDLRYTLKSLGYGGGLKGCEKKLGIDREELDGVDGFFAVLLWLDYKRNGNRKALETLLAYNILDAVNLERLMVIAYNLKLKNTPFSQTHTLMEPPLPGLPFEPDTAILHKIRQQAGS